MSPLYVWPYMKVHKTNDRDAEAIAEAASRPTMSFVTVKSAEQLDLLTLKAGFLFLTADAANGGAREMPGIRPVPDPTPA